MSADVYEAAISEACAALEAQGKSIRSSSMGVAMEFKMARAALHKAMADEAIISPALQEALHDAEDALNKLARKALDAVKHETKVQEEICARLSGLARDVA